MFDFVQVSNLQHSDQHEMSTTAFFQETGLRGSFAQGLGCLSEGNTLADRQNQSQGAQIASIVSMIVPVWPGGTYRTHLVAAASPVAIDYGFYYRVHLLGADAAGNPDSSTDTSFELLGTLSEQPGIGATANPGVGISAVAPSSQSWDFDFAIPLSGAGSVTTSVGSSVLSGTLNSDPRFVYVEPLLWDPVANTSDLIFAIVDDIRLVDLNEGVNSRPVAILQFTQDNITSADTDGGRLERTFTPNANSTFRFSQYLVTTSPGTYGNVTASCQYRDSSGQTQTSQVISVDPTVLGSSASQTTTFQGAAGQIISVNLFFDSANTGNPAVSWNWTLEQITIA